LRDGPSWTTAAAMHDMWHSQSLHVHVTWLCFLTDILIYFEKSDDKKGQNVYRK